MRVNKRLQLLFISLTLLVVVGCAKTNWRETSREPAGIAPVPSVMQEAVIQFYAADAFSWRGWFAVHSWLAVKPKGTQEYTVYEVVGWGVKNGRPALREYKTKTPDRFWYGAEPEAFLTIVGEKAERLIPKITEAVNVYPWKDEYTLFPGPNSNTFPAWIGEQVPELELKMPFRAIGSGYAN